MSSKSTARYCRKSGRYESPRSLPLLVALREQGRFHNRQRHACYGFGNPQSFVHGIAQQLAPRAMVQSPRLIAPLSTVHYHHHHHHRRQQQQQQRTTAAVQSLHVDRTEQRFVLTGGSDAIVNIYDLSKWGSEEYFTARQKNDHDKNKRISSLGPTRAATVTAQESLLFTAHNNNKIHSSKSTHKPIASSQREPPRALALSDDQLQAASLQVPSGHAAPISKVQWYPVDTGAFLSTSMDGTMLIWDTNTLSPVAKCTPFNDDNSNGTIGSFHLSSRQIHSAVVASLNDPALKLVDIRSGASSHTLLGHAHPGISSVQWAPHNDVLLASGGLDGTIRLWDIRKAGSRACIAILNQDNTHPPAKARAYKADYSHLPKPSATLLSSVDDKFAAVTAAVSTINGRRRGSHYRRSVVNNQQVAPNNYRPTENSTVLSHNGSISALSFGAENDGHSLVSASQDGNLHIWDLRGNGHLQPLRFMAPGRQPAIPRHKKQVPLLLTPWSRFGSYAGSGAVGSAGGGGGGCCWVGNESSLLGYSLDRGGMPQQVLQGHLHTITAMDVIASTMQILTAGKDGMILTWGKPTTSSGPSDRKRIADSDNW